MVKNIKKPKAKQLPKAAEVRMAADPESYLKRTPVWRFSDFDWEGPWGHECVVAHVAKIRDHIEQHLASLETMTWQEILRANGGKGEGKGNNSHEVSTDKFKPDVKQRLKEKKIFADTLFSLRLDAGTRLYGVRENHCLRLVFFDPYHKDKNKCAYEFSG